MFLQRRKITVPAWFLAAHRHLQQMLEVATGGSVQFETFSVKAIKEKNVDAEPCGTHRLIQVTAQVRGEAGFLKGMRGPRLETKEFWIAESASEPRWRVADKEILFSVSAGSGGYGRKTRYSAAFHYSLDTFLPLVKVECLDQPRIDRDKRPRFVGHSSSDRYAEMQLA
ncbi:MAG TPA: hypothetical protein VHD37_01970 [Candidatus Paceibacterota bacterium]|nr:hypothetical protein [Candidatus Paceibacterota bacterium]